MKRITATAFLLAIAASVAAGALGHALYAQAKPPVYMIAVNDVTDQEGYAKDYGPKAKQSIVSHGGVYVAAGKGTLIDGHVPTGRVVILRWESMDQMEAWRHSPEYENIRKIGEKYAKYNIVTVEGVPQK